MAQLVAHLHGMQGVRGSSPLRSTKEQARSGGLFCFWPVHVLISNLPFRNMNFVLFKLPANFQISRLSSEHKQS